MATSGAELMEWQAERAGAHARPAALLREPVPGRVELSPPAPGGPVGSASLAERLLGSEQRVRLLGTAFLALAFWRAGVDGEQHAGLWTLALTVLTLAVFAPALRADEY